MKHEHLISLKPGQISLQNKYINKNSYNTFSVGEYIWGLQNMTCSRHNVIGDLEDPANRLHFG